MSYATSEADIFNAYKTVGSIDLLLIALKYSCSKGICLQTAIGDLKND